MKTLKNQTLLYDQDCPLCSVYTTGFIKSEMLDKNGRKSYCELSEVTYDFVDFNRATNEIALVDTQNKTVVYGIDSLLKVIGFSFPWISKIGYLKPVNFFLRKFYSFISYNRKVIIPSNIKKEETLECVPDYNYKYRVFYILFTALTTILVLYNYSHSLSMLPKSTITRESLITFGQIIFQSIFLLKLDKKVVLNYIGNLMTVSLMGSLILTPLLLLNTIINIPENGLLIWFGLTVFIMLIEHYRRIKILELPTYLSYTWVVYRIIVLLIIINLS